MFMVHAFASHDAYRMLPILTIGEKDMAGKGKAAYERYGGKRFVLAAGEKDMAGKAGKRSLRFGGKTPRHPTATAPRGISGKSTLGHTSNCNQQAPAINKAIQTRG